MYVGHILIGPVHSESLLLCALDGDISKSHVAWKPHSGHARHKNFINAPSREGDTHKFVDICRVYSGHCWRLQMNAHARKWRSCGRGRRALEPYRARAQDVAQEMEGN